MDSAAEPVVFLHFPPVFGDFVCRPLVDVMKSHGVSRCYYGHIHGKYAIPQSVEYEGIKMILISADYLDFVPQRVFSSL
jgi:predicted phosphohydrolase